MSRYLKYLIIVVLSVTLFCAMPAAAAPPQSAEQQLRQSINSLYKARVNIINNHLERGKNLPPSATQESDFRLFLSYLDGRILYYCEQLFSYGGSESLNGTPCPIDADGSLITSSYSTLPPGKIKTEEEKAAALDNELQASLGAFDDMLLKEQEQIAATVPKQRESSSYQQVSGNKEGVNRDGQSGMGNHQKTASGSTADGNRQTTKPGSTNRGTGAGSTRQTRIPPTSGNKDLSQSDDDIVAKQLREAAEQETDPEVKARLWEEYENYKQGVN